MAQQNTPKPYPIVLTDTAESTILAALKTLHAVVADPGTPDPGLDAYSVFPSFEQMGSLEDLLRITNRVGKALSRKEAARKEARAKKVKAQVTESVETHPNTTKARRYRDEWVGLSPTMKEEYPFKKSYTIPLKDIFADIGAASAEVGAKLLQELGYTLSPSAVKGEFNLVLPLVEPKAPTAVSAD